MVFYKKVHFGLIILSTILSNSLHSIPRHLCMLYNSQPVYDLCSVKRKGKNSPKLQLQQVVDWVLKTILKETGLEK